MEQLPTMNNCRAITLRRHGACFQNLGLHYRVVRKTNVRVQNDVPARYNSIFIQNGRALTPTVPRATREVLFLDCTWAFYHKGPQHGSAAKCHAVHSGSPFGTREIYNAFHPMFTLSEARAWRLIFVLVEVAKQKQMRSSSIKLL